MTDSLRQLRASFEKIRPWITMRSMELRLDELIRELETGELRYSEPQQLADGEIETPF